MREILEAARRGTPSPPKDDSAEPPASPTDSVTPKKPLSMAEKLAAARGTAPKPAEAAAEPALAATPVPPPSAEVAATRELADELRRAGARKDEETANRPPVEPPVGVRPPFSPPTPADAATTIEPPSRSQLHVDHRGVLLFVSWTAIGRAALAVAVVLATWMMVAFLFPGADATP